MAPSIKESQQQFNYSTNKKQMILTSHNEDDDDVFKGLFPLPFSSTLHERLNKLSLGLPLGTIDATLSEQFYFQRIGRKDFPGHHNLVLAADVVPTSSTSMMALSQQDESASSSSIDMDEGQKLQTICHRCIDVLKWRHPMLCAVPTLKDGLLKKLKRSSARSAEELFEKEVVLFPGAIQFEIVQDVHVQIDILNDEDELLRDVGEDPTVTTISNEDELIQHLLTRELSHMWNSLENTSKVTAFWKISLIKSRHTDGKWVCCFCFFHAICDASAVKFFLGEFANLFDYLIGGKVDPSIEKELETLKTKAMNNIYSTFPLSPIQALSSMERYSTKSKQSKKGNKKSNQTPAPKEEKSHNKQDKQEVVDIPKKLGKWGRLMEYSKFVSRVISYNGLSPAISFPVKSPFPNPCKTKIMIKRIDKETCQLITNLTKHYDLTITSLIHSICTTAWTLCNRLFNSRVQEKTKFGFTNNISVDFRDALLPVLSKESTGKEVFRNYSSTLLCPTRINHLPLECGFDSGKESDKERILEIIWDLAQQTKQALSKKYHDALATYQIVHKFLKFDISKKDSFQMVFSNIGKLDNLFGKNVRLELLCGAYSSTGSTTGLSNIFYTNTRTGEMEFSLCYSDSCSKEHISKYMEIVEKCIHLLVDQYTSTIKNQENIKAQNH